MSHEPEPGDFDAYADHYGDALRRGIGVSGESTEYFARGRVEWLRQRLRRIGASSHDVLDYGCGTGTTVPVLREVLSARSVTGIDVSEKSIARGRARDPGLDLLLHRDVRPAADRDVVYCNGVFHHIPPAERPGALEFILQSLRPGGVFALWENNPWNPGTQIVMRRIPFDRGAVKVSSIEARRLVRAAGFEVISTDFLFIFPRMLSALRFVEPALSGLPLGAQYQVLARKPG